MGNGRGATEAQECALTQRHFVLQDDRPDHLREIDLAELDPALRCLLFTDGTVTRTLEVQALSRVAVAVLSQDKAPALERQARCLEVPSGMEALRRRVAIGAEAGKPVMWAESHIIPSRLPRGFMDVLGDAADGIGESLQQVQLESWRDMLWFGLDTLPAWSEVGRQSESVALTRLYRVITNGRPALLISESFAVRRSAGLYHLDWLV
ncbi:MAG: chorismate pyruvate-lyase family protein [Solirubrobacterales bacterium]